MTYLDLHMHSSYSSDGDFSPEELLRLCQGRGIRVMALTDHNSIKGIPEAMKAARKYGIQLIPGIELDCTFHGVNLHVLGYGIRDDERYHAYEKDIEEQERLAGTRRMELVRELGISFSEERVRELSPMGIITGEILAEAAMEEEANRNHPLMKPYFPGGGRDDNPYVNFYWDLCANGRPAYVPVIYKDLSEVTELIADTGGVAVLAHPGQNIGCHEGILEAIIAQGIHGLEALSSYHDDETRVFYLKKAKEHGLFITAGSDFHGKTKPSIRLGPEEAQGREEEILKSLSEHLW